MDTESLPQMFPNARSSFPLHPREQIMQEIEGHPARFSTYRPLAKEEVMIFPGLFEQAQSRRLFVDSKFDPNLLLKIEDDFFVAINQLGTIVCEVELGDFPTLRVQYHVVMGFEGIEEVYHLYTKDESAGEDYPDDHYLRGAFLNVIKPVLEEKGFLDIVVKRVCMFSKH